MRRLVKAEVTIYGAKDISLEKQMLHIIYL
jgi:hypothetical protein